MTKQQRETWRNFLDRGLAPELVHMVWTGDAVDIYGRHVPLTPLERDAVERMLFYFVGPQNVDLALSGLRVAA